tara:strand:+ start:913 stop:1284 length:372 start_codon:yes stop_codon:yes gene_type:complete
MLKRLNNLEKQYGGAIPFSALEDKKKTKKKVNKKSPSKKRNRKRSISPSRMRRKITKKPKRTKKKQTKKKGNKCECGSHKFTGHEETPRGLGHCEECIPLNVVLKGKDGKLYENRKGGWHRLN